jgi:hypothetical protein
MRTSLNEIKLIEEYLRDRLDLQSKLIVEGRIIADNDFRRNVNLQRMVYKLLERYNLEKIKNEVKELHLRLVNGPDETFRNTILQIFQKR